METFTIIIAFLIILMAITIYKREYGQTNTNHTYTKYNKNLWATKNPPKYNYSYMPYKKAYLLTKTEHIFFITLVREALKRKLLVCPKVRLEDIAYVPKIKNRNRYRGYIKSRHVDFVLLNPQCETVAAIELDDPSHDQPEAEETDLFKNELFKSIGVPLIRIKTGINYVEQINAAFDTYNLNGEVKKS